jgi:hypothetical protein
MAQSIAIVFAGILIAFAIVLTQHWQLQTNVAASGLGKLNRWTGEVSYCRPQVAGQILSGFQCN